MAISLLICHLGSLAFFCIQWIKVANTQRPKANNTRLSPYYICYTMFVANFIGIAFSRTLHYQFYAWYISSAPFLLWNGIYPIPLRMFMLAALEFAFLTFPATATSSQVLQIVHIAILLQIRAPRQIWEQIEGAEDATEGKKKW
jgi:alpha-1,3-mannosyltransferase